MSNDFKAFAGGGGANVLTQAQYEALATIIANGFQTGVAPSNTFNKVWRQSTIMAAVLGTLIEGITGQNVVDDGTTATIASNLMAALALAGYKIDTGVVNAYVVTLVPAPLAYYNGMKVSFKTANTNTSATPTLNVNGLGAIAIAEPGGSALALGALQPNAVIECVYNSTGPRFEMRSYSPSTTGKTLPINLNGNFQIAQAGTSFAAPASTAYDLDGWQNINSTAAVFTVSQGAGSASRKLARLVTITTADSTVAAGDIVQDQSKIEGYDIVPLVGNTFTVSFNAKFPITGIHCVALRNAAGDRSYVHEVNVTAANTWASYSFTVTGGLPTAGTWVYTNADALRLNITHMAGTTYTGTPATADTWMSGGYFTTANQVNDCATVGNVWALEDVRIDLGSVPGTDWPSYQENLAACQRYYKLITRGVVGFVYDANRIQLAHTFARMRATPTAALENSTFQISIAGTSISAVGATITDLVVDYDTIALLINGFVGLIAGDGVVVRNGAVTSFISLSARL